MTIEELMSQDSCIYRFHAVRSATLARLQAQSDNGQIVLWGRVEDEDEDGDADYARGEGELSTTQWRDIEMSASEFCDAGGVIFVLEPALALSEPREERHATDRREWLVQCEEWRIVGGLVPSFDEDEDLVELQAVSCEEIMSL